MTKNKEEIKAVIGIFIFTIITIISFNMYFFKLQDPSSQAMCLIYGGGSLIAMIGLSYGLWNGLKNNKGNKK